MKLFTYLLFGLFGIGAFAADTAKCVKNERVTVTEYERLPNGKLHIVRRQTERRNAYVVNGERVEIVANDSDSAEVKAFKDKTGRTVTLSKGKVKP